MELRAEVEENNRKSDCSPLSKHSGSLIGIDSIYIDLASAMDSHQDVNHCDHFSLREYVVEMRKKDIGVCLPFSADNSLNESKEQKTVLPPLDVAKFKWWSCHNCLREIGAACCAREIVKVSDSSPSGFVSKGSDSVTGLFSGAVKRASAITCTEVNTDKILMSSCCNDKEKKDGQSMPDGSGNDAYHQINPVMKDIVNSKVSLIPESHADGTDAMDVFGSSFRGCISSNIRHLENNGRSFGVDNSVNGQQGIKTKDCESIPKVSSRSTGNIEVIKENTTATRLVDDLSSESGNIYSKTDQHAKLKDGSTKSVGQRGPKVRLLTELLDSGGNAEKNQSRTTESESDSASDFCDDIIVQTIPKQHSKGKRRISRDQNGDPLLLLKKSKLSKGGTDIAKMNCMVVESDKGETSGICGQQKNLKNQVSSKKKHKQIQHEGVYPIIMPRPDVAKDYHFAPTEGPSKPTHPMYSTEMDSPICPLQAKRKSSMSKTKSKQVGVGQAVSAPQCSKIPGEGSSIRKYSDVYGRKGVDLSLSSFGMGHRNEESHIAKAQIGAEPSLLPWSSTAKEPCHQVKNILHARELSVIDKSAPDLSSGKGFLFDLNEKIVTQSPIRDTQNAIPQFGKGSIQHHRELNISGTCNGEPKIDDQDKGNEDIPMDIVELMAKNQYDRCRQESERNYFSPERTSEKRKFESMGLSRVHGNGVLKYYQAEDHSVRKPLSRTTTVKSGEHLAPTKVNPINAFPDINESNLNMSNMVGKESAFARCSSFFNSQGTESGRSSYPNSGAIRYGNYQNFRWKSDHIGSSFSPPKVGYSVVSNYTNFPRSCASQVSNFGSSLQTPRASSRGEMAKKFDLNFVNGKYQNYENQNMDFGFESFQKSTTIHPFASKNQGIDLNAKVSGSLDIHSNEAIPAMQLLSLMDAGMKSNPIFNLGGNQKMISKPLPPCDYHPKVLGKPPFVYDHHSKEIFGRVMAVSTNASRPSSSSTYGKNHQRVNNSYECSPPIPTFGPFSSRFENGSNFIRVGNGVPTQVPSKFEEKKKGPAQINSRKLQKHSQNCQDSDSIRCNQRGSPYMTASVSPQSIPGREICFVNRNPADFSIPEPGNIYMINGKDLKSGKKISSRRKQCSANEDGKKKPRVTVTATRTQ